MDDYEKAFLTQELLTCPMSPIDYFQVKEGIIKPDTYIRDKEYA